MLIYVIRQKKFDKYEQYQASMQKEGRKRSKSQSRYNDGQYVNASGGGTMAFPQTQPAGYGSNPPSDIERAMNRLTLGGLKAQGNDAAAQRQTERGRRLSGGVLGLSGSAAQQAQQLQQQQEQQRMMRERSRSRQPYDRDETVGGIRPAYMPAGRGGNIANMADPGLIHAGQPNVFPSSASQYTATSPTREDMARMAGGGGQYVIAQGNPQQNVPQQNIPYGYQAAPQVSPMFPQQQLPQATVQFSPSQFVPVTTAGGIQTMGVPVGHISQLAGFPAPGVSPINPTMDINNPYLTPAYVNQQMPPAEQQQTRRRTNIADVVNPQQQQQQQYQQQYVNPNTYINPKTILTPAPPPKQLHTSNINNINNGMQQQGGQTRGRPVSGIGSGYVPAAGNIQPPVGNNRHSAYISGSGSEAENKSVLYPMRPGLNHSDTLQSSTGPQGFGSRPTHTREPSYKANIKPTSRGSQPESLSSRTGVPVVSMRPPDKSMVPQHFSPKLITYDLNGEHRQESPLRFGRFIYDRDCTHEGKSCIVVLVFLLKFAQSVRVEALHPGMHQLMSTALTDRSQQILDTWGERNPAFNYYHSAVKRIDAILSAWNFAFFHPRGMDVVLFKGNERRSGPRFGEPESAIEFLTEASPPSDDEESSSEESEEDEENPAHYLASMNPQYRAQIEREKAQRRAHREEGL